MRRKRSSSPTCFGKRGKAANSAPKIDWWGMLKSISATTWRWIAAGFCALSAVVFLPSLASGLLFAAALLTAPIPALDEIIRTKLHLGRGVRIGLVTVIFICSTVLVPADKLNSQSAPKAPSAAATSSDNATTPPISAVSAEPEIEPQEAGAPDPVPTVEPDPSPAPEPASTPDPEPAPAPEPAVVEPEPEPQPEPTPEPVRVIEHEENYHGHVYATPRGERYHYEADCGGKNSTEITWDAVDRRGLTPCGTCVLK